MLEQGLLMRATAATGMNRHSSRSHAVFTIALEQRRQASAAHSSSPSLVLEIGLVRYLLARLVMCPMEPMIELGSQCRRSGFSKCDCLSILIAGSTVQQHGAPKP